MVETQQRDAKLLPVAGWICLCYFCILSASYFIGNMIYQIP